MKKTMIVGGTAALAFAVAIGSAALAQQAPAERPAPRADANRDGQITRTEFVDARIQRLSAMDTNRDGSITGAERAAAKQASRAERMAGRFERLDTDGNGSISRAEFDARPNAARSGPRAGRAAMRGERMAARRNARAPMVIAEAEARTTAAFARIDADNNGVITVAERRSARQQMREVRQERRAERVARRTAARSQTQSPPAPGSE